MHTLTSIYKSGPVAPMRQKWALCCASSVLLTLVSLHAVPVQAQDLQAIEIDSSQLMKRQTPTQQGGQSQPANPRAPAPLSDRALQIISNVIMNLSPTGRELMLSKSYTPEQRQQILTYMESQAPKSQAPQQEAKQPLLTLEQQRQLLLGEQSEAKPPVKEEIKQTEKPTTEQQKQTQLTQPPEQQKQLEQVQSEKAKEQIKQAEKLTPEQQKQLQLTQQLEQQKQLEQVQSEKAKEQIKQAEKLTPEQQKQMQLTQQLEQQKLLEKTQQQQLKEEIKQVEKPVLEQPKQILPTQQTSLPVDVPANPASLAQEKYQKLLDAGVFSSSGGTSTNLDETMTRAQFAAIAAKLQDLGKKSGGQFADIDPAAWAALAGAMEAKSLSGISSGTIKVESEDKKSSADFAALLAAVMKGRVNQEELDQLIAKLGTSKPSTSQVGAPLKNEEEIQKVGKLVEAMVVPAPGSVPVTTALVGVSAGSLAAIGAALAAATAASIAASGNANNIALANAVNGAANYNTVTPRANWPTNLNATFNGRLGGTLSDNSTVGGNLSMNVNFASIGSNTPIFGSVQFDNNKGSAHLQLVQSSGFVGGGMSGTYDNQTMNGYIQNGQFYGPAANAIKGSWSMTTPVVSGGGSFAATR